MNLSSLTNESLIVLNSQLNQKEDIIRALVKKLYNAGKISSEKDFFEAIYAREILSETGMDEGLAIPHGKSWCVKEASFAVMSTVNPVEDWESIEPDNKVHYIFMLAIPEVESGSTHLELLAELMTKMSDSVYKDKLFASKTVEEFYYNLDSNINQATTEVNYTKTIVAVTACPAGIAHTYMSAEALVKAGNELGVKVYVEKQGANGIEDRQTTEHLQEADAAIFAVGVAVKEPERFAHLAITKVPVAEPMKDGKGVIERALKKAENYEKGTFTGKLDSQETSEKISTIIKQSVMTGISYMIPIIVAGGMIGAFTILVNNIFGLGELYNAEGSWLWSFRMLGSGLVGSLLIPVLSAYMAYSISDKTALAPGFAAGLASNIINGGFLCGMLGGLIAGFTVKWLKKAIPARGTFAGFISFWIYPVFSTLIVGTIIFFLVGEPVAWINSTLISILGSLGGTNAALLGAVIGIMVSFDLGGPVNKAAYAFCAGAMAEGILGPYAVFAACKLTAGIAVTFATLVAKELYTEEERVAGQTTWLLVLGGITEGAIPFMMEDPVRVIFSFCTGTAVTGAIVSAANIGLDVPGAGIFSIFMLKADSPILAAITWTGAAVIGAVVSAFLLVVLRKRKMKNQVKKIDL